VRYVPTVTQVKKTLTSAKNFRDESADPIITSRPQGLRLNLRDFAPAELTADLDFESIFIDNATLCKFLADAEEPVNRRAEELEEMITSKWVGPHSRIDFVPEEDDEDEDSMIVDIALDLESEDEEDGGTELSHKHPANAPLTGEEIRVWSSVDLLCPVTMDGIQEHTEAYNDLKHTKDDWAAVEHHDTSEVFMQEADEEIVFPPSLHLSVTVEEVEAEVEEDIKGACHVMELPIRDSNTQDGTT
jgi:hypothetical protein